MNIIELLGSLDGAICGNGASDEEIKKAEEILGLKFAKDYIYYLKLYGAIMINGHSLTGLSKSKQLDVISNTVSEKELNINISNDMYVVENTAVDGIVIWQASKGNIYESSFDGVKKINESFSDYLEKYVLK